MAVSSALKFPNSRAVDSAPVTLSAGTELLQRLVDRLIVLPEEWDELSTSVRVDLLSINGADAVIRKLVDLKLITSFQAEMLSTGRITDLVVGHYRLLEPLGHGGMGRVYRVEHVHLRRVLALKLMTEVYIENKTLLDRFFLEARAVARLQHPNLVTCQDAGRHESEIPGRPIRCYYVMELIPGEDLGKLVESKGPLSVNRAAGLFRQVAQALAEAHRHRLIHRDIKPGNIVVTPDWQAKVLDFGLALHPDRQMTHPGEFLGTVGYMAPEQAKEASTVDARADLFSLGATLYLALTGRDPFLETGNAIRDLIPRLSAPPPRIRAIRPELPAELDDLVARLMDPDPNGRLPSAFAVGAALTPFVRWRPDRPTDGKNGPIVKSKVLIADDDPNIRRLVRTVLKDEFDCVECSDGAEALNLLETERFDLVTIDLNMPRIDGTGVIERVRQSAINSDTMILICSGEAPAETLGGLLLNGADDFIQKPMSTTELRSRVRGLINRRSERANVGKTIATGPVPPKPPKPNPSLDTVRISSITRELPPDDVIDLDRVIRENDGGETAITIGKPPSAALVLGKTCSLLLEEANIVARGHGMRLPRYVRTLAAATSMEGEYRRLGDSSYLEMVAAVAPLHDVGCLVIPGDILHKPGRITADERMIIQTHTTVGSEIVVDVAAAYANSLPYLTLAAEIVRSHHERWDGGGYPDALAAQNIPLAARIVGIISVYDALRCRRPYRPAINHSRAVQMICDDSPGHFDPILRDAFNAAASQFEVIFQQIIR